MNAAGNRLDPDPEHDADGDMLSASRRTFSGFVRSSTYTAVAIAVVLIALALFLL